LAFPEFTQYFAGQIERKFVQDGEHRVELSLQCTNQWGKVTTPGRAVVALPLRHDELSPVERRSRQSVG